jgi:small subunit ribosomal protein S6
MGRSTAVFDYELIYIVDPELSDEQVAEVVNRVATVAKQGGAQAGEPERWPRRRLAYPIKEKTEGYYVVTRLSAEPAAIKELDRVLKLTEPVLRHMVVRLDEKKAKAGGEES